MARKDVDLVIRAKNEATKAIDAIGKAFEDLSKDASSVQKSGDRVDSTLANLTKALGDLTKAFGNASGAQKFAAEVGTATAALEKLEAESQTLAANQKRLKDELDQSTASTARLRQETQNATTTLAAQSTALDKAKADQAALSGELRAGTSARVALQNADERMVDKIDKVSAKLDGQKAKYAELATQLANTAEPTKTFQNRVEAAAEAVTKSEAKLEKLSQAYIANRGAIQTAASTEATLKQAYESGIASIEAQKNAIADNTAQLGGLKTATREAASTQKGFEAQLAETGNAAAQQATKIAGAREAIQAIGDQSQSAKIKLAELNDVVGNQLAGVFQQTRRETLLSVRSLAEMQTAAKAMALELRATAKPAQEAIDKFQELREAIRAQKAEVQANRLGTQNIGKSLIEAQPFSKSSTGPLANPDQAFQQTGGSIQEAAAKIAAFRAGLQGAVADARAAANATAAIGKSNDFEVPTKGTNSWADAFRSLYGEGRQTLSFTQRLRGEVLSLIAAYVGFQAAVDVIKRVVKANTELETAQSRLNVAFEGKTDRVASEYDFIRRNANRLGIDIGVLAGEYGKFAIATQGTNLEGDKTRKIFLAVAEAGKVNKTSLDDLKGTFLALTQIVSKGSVMSEELKGQLGERLPGAVSLFANALGKTTAEFIKMLEQGQVSSDMLDKFADALNSKFGPALGLALQSTSAQIGFFEANLTNALLVIGKSGAIEGFTKFITTLNEQFKSSQGVTFFQRIGAAIGTLFDGLRLLLDNIRLVGVAFGILIAIKLIPFFLAARKSIIDLALAMVALPGQARTAAAGAVAGVATIGTAATASAVGVGVLRTAFIGLRIAIVGALSATGIGVLVTVLGTALGYLLTSTNETTDGMVKQATGLDALRDAYDKFKDKPKELAEALGKISKTDAEVALRTVTAEAKKLNDQLVANPFSYFKQATGTYTESEKQILALQEQVKNGTLSIEDFKKKVDDLAQADPKLDRTIVLGLISTADKASEAAKQVEIAQAKLAVLQGSATDAQVRLLELGKSFASVTKDVIDGIKQLDAYNKALDSIRSLIPELAADLKRIKDLKTLETDGNDALGAAIKLGSFDKIADVLNNSARANVKINEAYAESAIKEVAGTSKITLETIKTVFGGEGIRTKAYQDSGGKPTIGIGNTRGLDGQPVQMGDTITEADAYRLAAKEISVFAAKIDAQVTAPLTDSMRNALISYAYNVGSVNKNIIKKLNDQDYAGAQEAIRNGTATVNGQPNSALAARRNKEADLFGKDGLTSYEAVKKEEEQQIKTNKTAEDYHDTLKTSTELKRQETAAKEAGTLVAAQDLAVAKEQAKASEKGTELTAEEIKNIRAAAEETYNLAHANDAAKDSKKAMAEADKTVNDLVAARNQLIALNKTQTKNGDGDAAAGTQEKLKGVNTELQTAIDKAIEMHKAIGGPGADAAIAKLEALRTTAGTVANTIYIDWNKVGTLFASNLTSAFDTFASEVAKGTKVGEAARIAFLKFASDFLKQVANMIIQQAILNGIKSIFPGFTGAGGIGAAAGVGTAGVLHDGGTAGSANRSRQVSPGWFTNAVRYHTGGVAGLAPNEVPAILEKGERISTAAEWRQQQSAAAAPMQPAGDTRIINAFDSAGFLEAALGSRVGEKVILNHVRANSGAFKAALGS